MTMQLGGPLFTWRSASRAIVLALVVLAAAGCRRGSSDPRHPDVPIRRFAEVDAGLFRGAQPDENGLQALKGLGVRTVVNFRKEDLDSARSPAGIEVVQFPAHINKPEDSEIQAFFAIALDPARRPLFIHCAEGIERTGFYAALYRMEVEGWTPQRALDEMREFGFRDSNRPEVAAYVLAYVPRGYAAAVAR